MKTSNFIILLLFCLVFLYSKSFGQSIETNGNQSNTKQSSEERIIKKDSVSFLQFISLFPTTNLSDTNHSVGFGNTIPMKKQYHKFLSNDLIAHTGSFLNGIVFSIEDLYVSFYNYMEEHHSGRIFYTHIILYNRDGLMLKDTCVLNGQEDPEYIGDWYINSLSITHMYYGPYICDDSNPVNCRETKFSINKDSLLKKTGERQFDIVKRFVW